ncbi:hypothetical protein [Shewanella marisflavi]|uniref:hypothetical protein n=1 Tax=Shewanella marisflavi TaxID=260364 RepID=UPI003AAB4223
MLFKPTAQSRQYPDMPQHLTAAIHSVFGARDDMALPLGAFFDKVSTECWLHQEGLWYSPVDVLVYSRRELDDVLVELFCEGICTGQPFRTPSGLLIEFELIDPNIEARLPSLRAPYAQ